MSKQNETESEIWDISAIDLSQRILLNRAKSPKKCLHIKQATPARLCLGRSGERYNTETYLRLRADHALAVDAVWTEMDELVVDRFGLKKIQSLIRSREEYLRYPDRGRRFTAQTLDELKKTCVLHPDVQIIVADGLSAKAISANLPDLYPILVEGIRARKWVLGTPLFVKYGRVATMDYISEALQCKVTVLLVGERPGLTGGGQSLSCYMAYEASPHKPESQRTVISNIHHHGFPPVEAGAQIVALIKMMFDQKTSGVELKY